MSFKINYDKIPNILFSRFSMRLPKGFGKNYFSLTAITATVNQITLHAQNSRVQNFHMPQYFGEESEELLEEELELLECEILSNSKPCHCSCHFLKKTKKILKLCPNQNYFFNYFKSLNSAISPPNIFYTQTKKIITDIKI